MLSPPDTRTVSRRHYVRYGHPFKLAYPDFRINVRENSFPVRAIALWNRLPENVVMASNKQGLNVSFELSTCRTPYVANCDFITF